MSHAPAGTRRAADMLFSAAMCSPFLFRLSTFALLMVCAAAAQQPAAPPAGPPPGPDSQVQPGTPTGEVIKGEFAESRVYPGTWREYWVYIPRQLDRARPAP